MLCTEAHSPEMPAFWACSYQAPPLVMVRLPPEMSKKPFAVCCAKRRNAHECLTQSVNADKAVREPIPPTHTQHRKARKAPDYRSRHMRLRGNLEPWSGFHVFPELVREAPQEQALIKYSLNPPVHRHISFNADGKNLAVSGSKERTPIQRGKGAWVVQDLLNLVLVTMRSSDLPVLSLGPFKPTTWVC